MIYCLLSRLADMPLLQKKIGINNLLFIHHRSRSVKTVDVKSSILDYVLLIPITLSQKQINMWLAYTRNLNVLTSVE